MPSGNRATRVEFIMSKAFRGVGKLFRKMPYACSLHSDDNWGGSKQPSATETSDVVRRELTTVDRLTLVATRQSKRDNEFEHRNDIDTRI